MVLPLATMSWPGKPTADGEGGLRPEANLTPAAAVFPLAHSRPIEFPPAFRPKTGTMDAWNAAYVRVEDYLRAHRIHNRLHQSRLIQEILERAARRHAQRPALDPTTLAAEETEAMMDAWFSKVLGQRDQ